MSYARPRTGYRPPEPLGWIQAIPAVISTVQSISSLTGGTSLAEKIRARVAWTVQMAQRGSSLAAAIIRGGANESSVNASERAAWADVAGQVPSSVAADALARYPRGYWPTGQADFYTDVNGAVHTQIMREVSAAGADENGGNVPGGGFSYPVSGGGGGQALAPMQTTAAYNWAPLALGAGFLLFVAPKIFRPSRRR